MPFDSASLKALLELFDFKSVRQQLTYEASASAAQIQAHLKQVSTINIIAQQRRKQCSWATWICIVLALISFMAAAVLFLFMYVLLAFIAAAVIAGTLESQWRRLSNFEMLGVRCMVSQQFIEMLDRDMAHNAAFNVRLDFSSPIARPKKVGQAPYARRQGWKQVFYEDPWLVIKGQLLDGTKFDLALTDLMVIRSGLKRGRSGKMKHKSKTKSKGFEAQLILQFPRKKYGALSLFQSELPNAIKLPTHTAIKQLKANDRQMLLRVKSSKNPLFIEDSQQAVVTQMFLSAYQALNLAKVLSKAAA